MTIDSLIKGHHPGIDFCPLIRSVRLLESQTKEFDL